jgi:hypothetical protein
VGARFLLCAILALAPARHVPAASPDETARFLAGLPSGGSLEAEAGSAWEEHAKTFSDAWSRVEKRQLAPIKAWAPRQMGSAYSFGGPMFYMFGGPDFLYAHAFYPSAKTYILCGLEPVGPIPDLAAIRGHLPATLGHLRHSLNDVLSWSFFITKDMKADLEKTELRGILPILYVFLARSDCRIETVRYVSVDKGGKLASSKNVSGVEIRFTDRRGQAHVLYYFTTNLENSAIKASPGFLRFCESQGSGVSLVKAASYLMHHDSFSTVREFLLRNSATLIQDDSGIPVRFFKPDSDAWSLAFYGIFTTPTELFHKYPQPDLARIYSDRAASPLPFGFGYQWRAQISNVMVAKKEGAAE